MTRVPSARLVSTLGLLLLACHGGAPSQNDVPDAGVSPQAKAEPTPLENVAPTSSAQPLAAEAGPPPVPLRSDEEVPADSLAKDATGWELEATLRTAEIPPAFRGPETSIVAIDAVKKKTEPHVTIDFTPSRVRIVLEGPGFLLPAETELRSRADRYGHFVLLPGAHEYRVAAPGSLRALLGERRIDVEPLDTPTVVDRGEGARRVGYRTRRVEVANRAATATFELARVSDAGEGGELLCRALLDLMNAPPSTPVCGLDDVPLHVEWRWATKGGLTFDVSSLVRRTDLAASALAAPPAGAAFALPSLSELEQEALVEPGELAAFRTAPAEVPPGRPDGAAPSADRGTRARQRERSGALGLARRRAGRMGRPGRAHRLSFAPPRTIRLRLAHLPRRRLRPADDDQRPGDPRRRSRRQRRAVAHFPR